MSPNYSSAKSFSSQRGAALVVAIFIITIMAILAAVIARVVTTSESASVDEVFGTRAYHAASSGAQVFATQLIDALEAESADAAAVCHEGHAVNFQMPGLQQCEAQVMCALANHSDFDIQQYQITSIGQCQSAQQRYSRILSTEVIDGQF